MAVLPEAIRAQRDQLSRWEQELATLESRKLPDDLEARAAHESRLETCRKIVRKEAESYAAVLSDYENRRRMEATAKEISVLTKRVKLESAMLNKAATEYRERAITIRQLVEDISKLDHSTLIQGGDLWPHRMPYLLEEVIPGTYGLKPLAPLPVNSSSLPITESAVKEAEARGMIDSPELMEASLQSTWLGHFG